MFSNFFLFRTQINSIKAEQILNQKWVENHELNLIDVKLPKNFKYSNVGCKNNDFTVLLSDQSPDWTVFFAEFKKINNIHLVYKHTNPRANNKSIINAAFMCHHGFRTDSSQYNADDQITLARKKKTDCKFEAVFTIKAIQPNVLVVKLNGIHNHEVDGAHAQSFRKILPETILSVEKLFENDVRPIDAKNEIENSLTLEQITDRSLNPSKSDMYMLYYKWIVNRYGPENGPTMFEKLEETISQLKNCNVYFSSNSNKYQWKNFRFEGLFVT